MVDRSELSVIIVNYRTPLLAGRCLRALAAERDPGLDFDVVVVDGGSGDGSVEAIRSELDAMGAPDWIALMPLPLNGGFAWANNQALMQIMQREKPPRYVALINPDTEVAPGALRALADVLDRNPKVAAVGSQLVDPDGTLSGSAFRFPSIAQEFVRGANTAAIGRLLGVPSTVIRRAEAGPAEWVTGASVMLRVEALREVGLFDEGFFLYFEEVELMWRLRKAGWELWFQPDSKVVHVGGAATGVVDGRQVADKARPPYWFVSRRRFFARTRGRGYALAAGLAWLAGHLIWRLHRLVRPGVCGRDTPGELGGLLGHGLLATDRDARSEVVRWNEAPRDRPAWMRTP